MGTKQFIELKTEDPVIPVATVDNVELLAGELPGESVKMPYEYGFKERIKLVKLKGGKPKVVRIKREKQLINLGGKVKGDAK